ncbi:MAG: tetratricopeptide repeat protein [Verrucomicrobium sp.]|nr:tetratricopeptide repeat protein [Verrucomicrobium sp.]
MSNVPLWAANPVPLADLIKKAEAGEGAAQLALAMRYDGNDNASEKNVDQAFRWYKAAAGKNYAEAQSALGLYYMKGEGTKADSAEGARWFEKAASQGHPVAQLNIASCYANAEGVSRDMNAAARWYREAAERNQPLGQYYLGILYGRGEGVPQSYIESYKWLTAAAAQGVKPAKDSLETLDSVLPPEVLEQARKAAAEIRSALVGR